MPATRLPRFQRISQQTHTLKRRKSSRCLAPSMVAAATCKRCTVGNSAPSLVPRVCQHVHDQSFHKASDWYADLMFVRLLTQRAVRCLGCCVRSRSSARAQSHALSKRKLRIHLCDARRSRVLCGRSFCHKAATDRDLTDPDLLRNCERRRRQDVKTIWQLLQLQR